MATHEPRTPGPPAVPDVPEAGPDDTRHLSPREATRHRSVLALSLLGTVLVGVLVATQSRTNGALAALLVPATDASVGWQGPVSGRVAAGLDAAVLSFVIGWCMVVGGALVTPRGRGGLAGLRQAWRAGRLRWWHLLGGLGGAAFVAAQGIAVPVLGVALFTVAVVAGLTVGGLVVDRVGLAPGGSKPLTTRRVVGCGLAIGGVALSVSVGSSGGAGAGVVLLVLVVGLSMLVGSVTAMQQAFNGHVAVQSGSPWTAAATNFSAGLTALLLLRLVLVGTVAPAPLPSQWWAYASAPIGLAFIVLAAVLVRTLGVLVLSLGNVAGQLLGSILLDELLPTAAGRPGPVQIAAAAVIFVAVALAASRPRTRRTAATG